MEEEHLLDRLGSGEEEGQQWLPSCEGRLPTRSWACFLLSLRVRAQPVDLCMFPTVAVPPGGSVGRALIPEEGGR